jgi:hypothetical protein
MIDVRGRASRSSVPAWFAAALAIATGLATAALMIAGWTTVHRLNTATLVSVAVPITFGFVGLLVTSRQHWNATGWFFLFVAVVGGLQGVAEGYARLALAGNGTSPGATWALWLNSWPGYLVFPGGALAMLLLVFPDGHLPSPKWRPFARSPDRQWPSRWHSRSLEPSFPVRSTRIRAPADRKTLSAFNSSVTSGSCRWCC